MFNMHYPREVRAPGWVEETDEEESKTEVEERREREMHLAELAGYGTW